MPRLSTRTNVKSNKPQGRGTVASVVRAPGLMRSVETAPSVALPTTVLSNQTNDCCYMRQPALPQRDLQIPFKSDFQSFPY
jgi:hypothetical protein